MKRLVVFALLLNALWLAERFWRELPVAAQGAGGGAPASCGADPTLYSADANDDGTVDVADVVHLLFWLFKGGPGPQVCLAQQPPPYDQLLEDLEFGHQLAGTWVFFGPKVHPGMATFTASGTYTDFDIDDFQNEFGGFDSPSHGGWIKTGDRQITVTYLTGQYDRDGTLMRTYKGITVVDFNETFSEATGTHRWEIFGPEELPHSCDAVPLEVGGPIAARGERLCAKTVE